MLHFIILIEIKLQIWYNHIMDTGIALRLKKTKNRIAFTLAEVMIVLLVLTILFAAFAPFITKRKRSVRKQDMWMWSSRNYLAGPMDTYYKPVSDNYFGGIYLGTTPDSELEIKSSYTPLSKLVIRSGYIANNVMQKQLQLRYGREDFDDPGQFTASFFADGHNLLFGSAYPDFKYKESDSSYPTNNVAFGYLSMNSVRDHNEGEENKIENNTAFGAETLSIIRYGKDNTAVGTGAGYTNFTGSKNTFIGYSAGKEANMSSNTLIGYNSQAIVGEYNTLIGANTGNAKENESFNNSQRDFSYNVALGYNSLGNIISGKYNVGAGAGSLSNLTTGNYNVAIGYNACSQLTGQSYKTCIGANSGPASDTPVSTELGMDNVDSALRTYIGANPNLNSDGTWKTSDRLYGGDAVMEIHNASAYLNNNLINNPTIKSNVTTIINGNLIVKGQTFLTMGDVLYPFYYSNNIFGTNANVNCAANQATYSFSNTGYCATLAPITNSSSDRRLKDIKSRNINGLDKIKQLNVYNYTFKNDPEKQKHVGVIAQELQKIFPNSVFKGSDGFLKISTDEILYAIINSIKELNNKILAATKKLSDFENKISKMENENKKLNDKINAISSRINKLKTNH